MKVMAAVGFPGLGVDREQRGQRRKKESGDGCKDGFHWGREKEGYWVAASVRNDDADAVAGLLVNHPRRINASIARDTSC